MARYDYGLRGPGDTNPPRFRRWDDRQYAEGSHDRRFDSDYGHYRMRETGSPRVTARYNQDYVRERGPMYPFNPYAFGSDRPGQIVGEDGYEPPYITRGGTWTSRGVIPPPHSGRRDSGPYRLGRYPDEL